MEIFFALTRKNLIARKRTSEFLPSLQIHLFYN